MIIANRYELIDEVGRGGMGTVVSCRDLHLDRIVVLKMLQDGIDNRRLLDEQKALANLRSKHVVQLYDIIDIKRDGVDFPAIILEYIDGKDLGIASHVLNEEYFLVIWQIACGLSDIHESKIVHRDIKPNNIKVDKEGVVKILDFGLARNLDDAKTRSSIGTFIFMAPELCSDKTINFSTSVDVYAFCITCLALLSNQPPRSLMLPSPIQPSFSDFSAYFKGVKSEIVELLYKCLDVNPASRPKMSEIRDALAKYLLKNKHRATVVLGGKIYTLNEHNKKINLNASVGTLSIEYDGFDFKVLSSSGTVFVNNVAATVGMVIPGCCVLTFGSNGSRIFVTFDVSNPEVVS